MSGSRAVVLTGDTAYQAGEGFLEDLARALESRDYQVVRLDVRRAGAVAELQRVLLGGADFVLAYNAASADLEVGGRSLYQLWDVPFLGWLVDNPIHQAGRLRHCGARSAIGCVDRGYLPLIRRLGGDGITGFFLPHFASVAPDSPPESRTMDVMLPGTLACSSAQIRAEWAGLPQPERSILADLAERALAAEYFDAEVLLAEAATRMGTELDSDAAVGLVRRVDALVRASRRERSLEALADAGIVVDLFGTVTSDHPVLARHRVHPPLRFPEALAAMARAKVVLNPVGTLSAGSHERVFCAMTNGAVAVSDRNRYWTEEFAGENALVLFEWKRLAILPERVSWLLGDSPAREAMAERARDAVRRAHLATHRIELLEDAARVLRGDPHCATGAAAPNPRRMQ